MHLGHRQDFVRGSRKAVINLLNMTPVIRYGGINAPVVRQRSHRERPVNFVDGDMNMTRGTEHPRTSSRATKEI